MDYTNYDFSSFFAILGGFAIFLFVLLLVFIVLTIVANWKMYKKAGKNGWECIVPVYGYWVLTEIAGLNWWWFLLAICDSVVSLLGLEQLDTIANLVSLFAGFNIYYNIAKRFKKSNGVSICAGIFSFIFIFIFGLSKNECYDGNIPVSKNGIFGTPEINSNNSKLNNDSNSDDHSYCGSCGAKVSKDAKFCPECGKEIN